MHICIHNIDDSNQRTELTNNSIILYSVYVLLVHQDNEKVKILCQFRYLGGLHSSMYFNDTMAPIIN